MTISVIEKMSLWSLKSLAGNGICICKRFEESLVSKHSTDQGVAQPRSQGPFSTSKKTLGAAGHVSARF